MIEIFVSGGTATSRQRLAGIIRSNLQTIHSQMPQGIRVREEIDATKVSDNWVSVATLQALEKGRKTFTAVMNEGRDDSETVDIDPSSELEAIEPASARKPDAPKVRAFISYAHHDLKYHKEFQMNLGILKNEGLIDVWYDGELRAGESWDRTIREEIQRSHIMVLLLSNAFFHSKYIQGVEFAAARKLHESKRIRVIPVLLEKVTLTAHAWLRSLQTIPHKAGQLTPILSFRPQRHGWVAVEMEIRKVIQELAGDGNLRRE